MRRRLPLLLLAVSFALWLACVAGAQESWAAESQAASAWVFVSVSGENRIAIFQRDGKTGQLKPHGQVELPGSPGSLALNAAGTRLYAAVRSKEAVSTLAVDRAAGRLELLDTVTVAGNPVYVAVDPSQRYLLSAYYRDGKAAVHRLNERGTVDAEAVSVLTTKTNPHCILPLREQPSVYVPNTGSDVILHYRQQTSSGTLEPADPHETTTAAGSGPRHAVQHPSQPWLFVVNEKDSTVSVFDINTKTGALTKKQKLSTLPDDFAGSNTCADIEVTPCGRYVYASNRGHDSIARYAVDAGEDAGASGALRFLGTTATEKTPREFCLDVTGRYLYAAGQASGRLAAYRIDPATGDLALIETYQTPEGPIWVEAIVP